MDRLYPPGRVWWAIRENSETSTHPQASPTIASCSIPGGVRLYEVLDVEKVFGQVIFDGDMLRYELRCVLLDRTNCILSSHMPHTYDGVLQQLYHTLQ